MGYVYAAMWLIVGIYLIYTGAKENRLFCFLGAYFVFLCIWWLIDELLPINMLDGNYAVVLRCISGAVLLIALIIYIIQKKAKKQNNHSGKKGGWPCARTVSRPCF